VEVRRNMEKHGCRCLSADNCVFMRICASPQGVASRFSRPVGKGNDILIIALWVDGNKISYTSAPHMTEHLVATLKECGYGFRNLGERKYSLGVDVKCDRAEGRRSISHASYLSTFFASLPWYTPKRQVTPARVGSQLKRREAGDTSTCWWTPHFRKCLGAMAYGPCLALDVS
jgi:hypothetical protein